MSRNELIAKLQELPEYADVLIGTDAGFVDFTIELGDDHPDDKMALIIIEIKDE